MSGPIERGQDVEKFEEPDFTQEDMDAADRALDAAARGEFDDVDYDAIGIDAPDIEEEEKNGTDSSV